MREVGSYECEICHEIFHKRREAAECEYYHKRTQYANCLWQDGYNLDAINHYCGFHWPLDSKRYLYKVTKNSRFIMSHLQCCDEPVYQIEEILKDGGIRVAGKPLGGQWYSTVMTVLHLPEPYKKEDE